MVTYDNEPTMMGHGRPAASIVIRQGTQAGMSFPLAGNQMVLGREEGLDIVLQDPESSRRHSRISWQGENFVVEDLGSTNGTFVNGVQITTPQILSPGDSIGIGQTVMVFQMVGAKAGPSPYYSTPQQQGPAPSYAPPPPASSPQGGKTTQYLLYGCGCLLLLCICSLLGVVIWVLLDPTSFENLTGFSISLKELQFVLDQV